MEEVKENKKVYYGENLLMSMLTEFWYIILVMVYYYFTGIFFSLKPVKKGNKRPIVLVTGFWGRNLYWRRLRNRLVKEGHPVYPVNLRFQVGDIGGKSIKLAKYLEENNIEDAFIIGHSMGGWIVLGLPEKSRERIKKLFTLSVSFQGSYICYIVPVFISSWQLMPGSKFTRKLKENMKYFNIKNIYTIEDEIAIPVETSILGYGDEVCFNKFGHMNLVMSKDGLDFLVNQIKEEDEKLIKVST